MKYTSLFDQMDETFNALARRAYEIFDGNGRVFGRELDNWFQAERELLHPVSLNITETDEAFRVKAEVPGFTEKRARSRCGTGPCDDHGTARILERRKEREDGLCRELLGPDPENLEFAVGNRSRQSHGDTEERSVGTHSAKGGQSAACAHSSEGRLNCQLAVAGDRMPGYRSFLRG